MLLVNIGARLREVRQWYREATGTVYTTTEHKRERWATPTPRRDSVARLLRFQSRLAAERKRDDSDRGAERG